MTGVVEDPLSSNVFDDESGRIVENLKTLRRDWQSLQRIYKAFDRENVISEAQFKHLQQLQAKTSQSIFLTEQDISKLSIYLRGSNSAKRDKLFLERLAEELNLIKINYNEVEEQLDALLKVLPEGITRVNRIGSVQLVGVEALVIELRKSLEFDQLCLRELEFHKIMDQVSDLKCTIDGLHELIEMQDCGIDKVDEKVKSAVTDCEAAENYVETVVTHKKSNRTKVFVIIVAILILICISTFIFIEFV